MTGWSYVPGERKLGDQVLLQVPVAGVEVTGWRDKASFTDSVSSSMILKLNIISRYLAYDRGIHR